MPEIIHGTLGRGQTTALDTQKGEKNKTQKKKEKKTKKSKQNKRKKPNKPPHIFL
jgi:hypothetical protein